jgi:hypothetical protein
MSLSISEVREKEMARRRQFTDIYMAHPFKGGNSLTFMWHIHSEELESDG